ncbi:MAG: DUF1592 domain-containing protein [Pirellulales bacterium]|nr:DUF1592 domain-containing protein [Pirellulales bacterium]
MKQTCLFLFLIALPSITSGKDANTQSLTFVKQYCVSCHDEETETSLNVEALSKNLTQAESFGSWVKIFDRIAAGEMPPQDAEQPNPERVEHLLKSLRKQLIAANDLRQRQIGRVPARRLTKLEYRYTLQDLLHISEDVTSSFPEETETGGFDTNGQSQRLSAVHMKGLMESADKGMDLAFAFGENPYQDFQIDILNSPRLAYHDGKTFIDGGGIYRRIGDGLAIFTDVDFLLPSHAHHFQVKRAGEYRISIDAIAYQSDVPLTLKLINKGPNGGGSLLGAADISVEQKPPYEFLAELQPGDSFYPTYHMEDNEQGGGIEFLMKYGDMDYQGKGIHIKSIHIKGPLNQTWPPVSSQSLLTGINLKPIENNEGRTIYKPILSGSVDDNIIRVVRQFASRAFRRPIADDELLEFADLAKPAIERGDPIEQILRVPLRAILSSPQFILFEESPGRLDAYALASRLSYFLWRSMPDAELFELAESGDLLKSDVLSSQVDRMLADAKSQRFVKDFLGQWLMLHKINANQPDQRLYWEYDELLGSVLLKETELFFTHLIKENLRGTNLINSEFVFVNRRLAQHYQIPNVMGQHLRKVQLPDGSPRGGILTHASVLKTTANGSATSPVIRGNFVLSNFYGTPPPSAPPSVGSVEPDIRGKSTIREILAAHRDVTACNVCHREIDPPGFALESFDPVGRFRDRYRVQVDGVIREDLAVDSSGVTPNGKEFGGIQEFKRHLMDDKDIILGNFISKLMEFATGAQIQFADREELNKIIELSKKNEYPVRDILHAVVQSEIFRKK